MPKGHEDLRVWQVAMTLTERIYEATRSLPFEERFGLTAQLRRAAVSVPSNIAEGRGRGTDAELLRFCAIAYGSLMELETQLELARRLRFVSDSSAAEVRALCSEVGRMLNRLRSSLTRAAASADDRRPTTDDASLPPYRRLATEDSPGA
jgi:four helix bundle protein